MKQSVPHSITCSENMVPQSANSVFSGNYLLSFTVLVSPQNRDTKVENTKNLLALIRIVVVPS